MTIPGAGSGQTWRAGDDIPGPYNQGTLSGHGLRQSLHSRYAGVRLLVQDNAHGCFHWASPQPRAPSPGGVTPQSAPQQDRYRPPSPHSSQTPWNSIVADRARRVSRWRQLLLCSALTDCSESEEVSSLCCVRDIEILWIFRKVELSRIPVGGRELNIVPYSKGALPVLRSVTASKFRTTNVCTEIIQ